MLLLSRGQFWFNQPIASRSTIAKRALVCIRKRRCMLQVNMSVVIFVANPDLRIPDAAHRQGELIWTLGFRQLHGVESVSIHTVVPKKIMSNEREITRPSHTIHEKLWVFVRSRHPVQVEQIDRTVTV